MPISELRFFGTGRSMNPYSNPTINREPSRRGVEFSGIKSPGELEQKLRQKLVPNVYELGDAAVSIARQSGNRVNLFG